MGKELSNEELLRMFANVKKEHGKANMLKQAKKHYVAKTMHQVEELEENNIEYITERSIQQNDIFEFVESFSRKYAD